MKITICGSMRFMPVMMALSGWLKQHGVDDIKIPEDVRSKSLHDEEFTSVLIKRRADHIAHIDKSDLVIVVCEPYGGHDKPRMIHSSNSSVKWLERAIRDSDLPVDVPDFIKSWISIPSFNNITDIYNCTLGYNIGESASFELISSLDTYVPVLIVPADDQQWACWPDMLKVAPSEVYLCDGF